MLAGQAEILIKTAAHGRTVRRKTTLNGNIISGGEYKTANNDNNNNNNNNNNNINNNNNHTSASATAGTSGTDNSNPMYFRIHHDQKDPFQKFTDDLQKTFESISVEMWRNRVESIEGGMALWPEPMSLTGESSKQTASSSALQATTLKATFQTADDCFQHLDFIILKDYALRRAKLRTKKQRKADMNVIFQTFTDHVQRTQYIDRFMLSLVLYFRYYLKHHKASRTQKDNHAKWAENYMTALQASNRDQRFVSQFASTSNLGAAELSYDDDGMEDKAELLNNDGDDKDEKQTQNTLGPAIITLGFLQRNMEGLMKLAGMSYMDILATQADPSLPEFWKEAYFTYMEVYLSECLKQVFINQFWAVIDVELQRLLKTEWFKINQVKTRRPAQKPLSGLALLASSKTGANEKPGKQDATTPEDDESVKHTAAASSSPAGDKKNESKRPFTTTHVPKTCPRAFRASHPVFLRPKTAPVHNTIDYSLYIDARVRKPHSTAVSANGSSGGKKVVGGSVTVSDSLTRDTLSFNNRVAGNFPTKPRKLFPTLVSAYQAAIDGETIKEGLTLVAAGSKTGAYQMCLEARSPLVTAVLDPNFGKSSEFNAAVGRNQVSSSAESFQQQSDFNYNNHRATGLSANESHDKRYNLTRFIESDRIKTVLHSAWLAYEKLIQGYGKDTMDPVDEIQLKLTGFKWNN